jgi:hypothetical protein
MDMEIKLWKIVRLSMVENGLTAINMGKDNKFSKMPPNTPVLGKLTHAMAMDNTLGQMVEFIKEILLKTN